MTLIPALLAILLLGILPIGHALSRLLASAFNAPAWVCLIALYVGFISTGTILLTILRHFNSESIGDEHDWFRLGDGRGQRFLRLLIAMTLGIGVAAIILSPGDAASLGCMLGAAVIAIAPSWALRRTTWPLDVTPFVAPIVLNPDQEQPPKPNQAESMIPRSFNWVFAPSLSRSDAGRYSLNVQLRRHTVDSFVSRDHPLPEQYTPRELMAHLPPYVLEGITTEVEQCAINLARIARQRGFAYLDFVDFILSFTCCGFRYVSDKDLYGREEYWAFPVETLMHQSGDCDDHAILSAALFHTLGIDTILIFVRNPCHLALGVALKMDRPGRWVRYNNRNYYYAEATGEGLWRLGELPTHYDNSNDNLVPIPIDAVALEASR